MGHLQANGFEVTVVDADNLTPIKIEHGVRAELQACHTAVVGGYVVEGHVPAAAIKRMLNESPDITGLAVPGMPVGSPGMDGPNRQPYNVYTFTEDGKVTVFEQH